MRRFRWLPYLLIAPALILAASVNLYPTLYSFYLSLHQTRRGALAFVGLRNFQILVDSPAFWNSVRLTGVFGFWFLLLVLTLATSLALTFRYPFPGRSLYLTIIFIPWMLSEVVSGVMWRWLFLPNGGILQAWLGLNDFSFLGTASGAMGVIVTAMIWRSLAFATLLLLAGLQTIPSDYTEAAAIDGANAWQRFWHITWHLLLPTTQVTLVFLSIQAVNAVGMVISITGGGPVRSTEVLSLYMYRETLTFFNFGYGAAISVIMFALNALLALIYLRGLQTRHLSP